MANAAVAEELPGSEELDELYRIDATEPEPEPGDDEPEDDEDAKPEEIPHG